MKTLLFAMLTLSQAGTLAAHEEIAGLVADIRPAIVDIRMRGVEQLSLVSGAVIGAGGVIVTGHVDTTARFVVRFFDDSAAEARLLSYDPVFEIAVLKVQRSELRTVELANTTPRLGESVIATGYIGISRSSLHRVLSVVPGVITAEMQTPETTGRVLPGYFVATNIASRPGTNLLFDRSGRLVSVWGHLQMDGHTVVDGLFHSAANDDGAPDFTIVDTLVVPLVGATKRSISAHLYQGYPIREFTPQSEVGSHFYPITDIPHSRIDALIQGRTPAYGRIGLMIGNVTSERAHSLGMPSVFGALITDVGRLQPDFPLSRGDVITGFGGVQIRGARDLVRQAMAHAPGQSVSIDVYREGSGLMTVEVTLDTLK